MNYKFDGIKIDEKRISENSEEISSIYMLNVGFKDLVEICGIGKISINREVDECRAKKMVDYIKDNSTFYPTILVATTKKNLINYDKKNKIININSGNGFKKNKDIIVIDGQHRYKSIELLLKEDLKSNQERYQSVLLLDNINEFQQRKIFVDVNDNSRKVTVGTKLRLEKNIVNYISLVMVDRINYLTERVAMDDNQTKEFDKIPYKFIIKGNKELLTDIEISYNKKEIELYEVDVLIEEIIKVWNKIFEVIKKGVENNCNIVLTEVFYIALCQEVFNAYKKKSNSIDKNFTYNDCIDEFFENLKRGIEKINFRFYSKDRNKIKEKINKLTELMGETYD